MTYLNTKTALIALSSLAMLAAHNTAAAQEPLPAEPPPEPPPATSAAEPVAPGTAPAAPTPSEPPREVRYETAPPVVAAPNAPYTPAVVAEAPESDHESVVESFAVGYLGRRSMLLGNLGPSDDFPVLVAEDINAPVIGIRYWISPSLGLDAGLGFSIEGGTQETPVGNGDTINQDTPTRWATLLHVGLPISLADAGHFSFQLTPEANVGFSGGTIHGSDTTDEIKLAGFHLDVGARAGAEIHFGFIDVPQLSLQGSVGVRVSYDRYSAEVLGDKWKGARTTFGTTVGDNPWNIFTSNVAALYYF